MDLRHFIEIFKRRKWVILVTFIVTVAIVSIGSYLMTPVYSATAVVRIVQIQDGNIGYYDLNYSERLMNTYVHLLNSGPFLEDVIQRINLNITTTDLAKSIKVEIIANTELIEIVAESTNPLQAMEIANTLGTLLVEQKEKFYTGPGRSAIEILQDELIVVEENLAEDRTSLQNLLNEDADLDQGRIIQDLSNRIQVQEQIYAMLINEYERAQLAEAARANSISMVEPATLPYSPSKPCTILNIILGAIIGVVGGIGLAFLFENLDLAIYNAEDLEAITKLTQLGTIPRLKRPKGARHGAILLNGNDQSPVEESFRILRTNVNALISREAAKTLLIVSADEGAGKSTMLANLAVVMAQAGRKVIMVDSDLRNPYLHNIFDLPNNWGLSTLIGHPSKVATEMSKMKTKFQRVSLLTSGPRVAKPSEWVGSSNMRNLLVELGKGADLILLDSPAISAVADAATLAPMVDGVILVAASGEITEERVQRALKQLENVSARLLGFVFNKVKAGKGIL